MRSAARGLLAAAAVALVAMVVGPAATAFAASEVTITNPLNGSVSNNPEPTFEGLAGSSGQVTLTVYQGPTAEGIVVWKLSTTLVLEGTWSLWPLIEEPEGPLEDGTYTAQARQGADVSSPVTFTVDTASPTVTLNAPEPPSDNTTPSFTGTASDPKKPVSVQIHEGASAKGTVVSMATAAGTGAGWRSGSASPALPVGQYTAVAIQESSIGNSPGRSPPVTFTVTPAPVAAIVPPAPPVASFRWVPALPQTGEPVLLVSSSTAGASPITGFAWALTSGGPFQAGAAVLSTSFSTSGGHVVRLSVTAADGLSSVATQTINVVGRTASLMQPFPVVRIAGAQTAAGVKLRLLKIQQVPAGARITVRCKGRGCPIRSVRRVTAFGKGGVAPVSLRAFERFLRSGVTLEILISKPGEIGKYTRFTVRRGKLPERVDKCLDPAGVKPLACPPS